MTIFEQKFLSEKDPKSRLQEWAQRNKKIIPVYNLVSQKGLAHSPIFEVEVVVPDVGAKRATGANKKEAMANAERLLLEECSKLNLKKEKRKK